MSDNKRHELFIGGTGGQGVISIGYAIAEAAAQVHPYVTRFPIYMATMRGGPAYCTIIFSDHEIPAPILSRAENTMALESGSYARMKKETKAGGRLFVNSSIVKKIDPADGYKVYEIPVTDLAQEMKSPGMANMIMLGAYRQITGILSDELMETGLRGSMTGDSGGKIDKILEAYKKGVDFAKTLK